jgi:hypothetical protein
MHSFMRWYLDSCANEIIDKRKNESKEGLLIQQVVILVCRKHI